MAIKGSKTKPRTRPKRAVLEVAGSASGKCLVIVESPAKARTINKYLGSGYVVKASVGHVRDLPKRNPKGVKNPVPGVALDDGFKPTYEIIPGKNKTVADLRKTARQAKTIYLATDMDREGEAIAWHLAQALHVPQDKALRVVFNAITKEQVTQAFQNPRPIDMDKVNAQQARRILDRIVGYQVSPLLWKKVAGGLSAGRVQSVAVRLIVDREREIQAFTPAELWKITAVLTSKAARAGSLTAPWRDLVAQSSDGKSPFVKRRLDWLANHHSFQAELVELNGKPFQAVTAQEALTAVRSLGFNLLNESRLEDPLAKGPARQRVTLDGDLLDESKRPAYSVGSLETKRTTSRPPPPLITSTFQQAAAGQLGLTAANAMRIAQQLYEGVEIADQGSVGLITYMRTDSTHIAAEALEMARQHIRGAYGQAYLPDAPNVYRSSNKSAQEAHEAIRPTDVGLSPDSPAVRRSLSELQLKVYRLIWQRFVASQMTPAEWDSTTVMVQARWGSQGTAQFKASGRSLAFDGYYRVTGRPLREEAVLPELTRDQPLGLVALDPTQHFTAPGPRYSEATLVKILESEGIGRPSTYAAIIQVIQDRKYVQKRQGRFHPSDLGMVVTDKLIEAFPELMEVGYTRQMEDELDKVEHEKLDWALMLKRFYTPFRKSLALAHKQLVHAKAEMSPAPYVCPECNSATVYRFGRNGRFLSCSKYPECKYAAPIDEAGKPQTPQATEVACPKCGQGMLLRRGRFGPFLSCALYPKCEGILNLDRKGHLRLPKPGPLVTDLSCPRCQKPLNLRSGKRGPWLGCSGFPRCRGRGPFAGLEDKVQSKWTQALADHEKANPQPTLHTTGGQVIGEGYTPHVTGAEGDSSQVVDPVEVSQEVTE